VTREGDEKQRWGGIAGELEWKGRERRREKDKREEREVRGLLLTISLFKPLAPLKTQFHIGLGSHYIELGST